MITREQIKAFRVDFEKNMETLEKKYGFKIQLGAISYGDTEFHGKMKCTELSATGEKQVNLENFKWLKEFLGFKGNIGDSYVDRRGITYTVYDLDGKKPKFPVLLKGSDGKNYKSTVEGVNMYLLKKDV